MTFPIAARFAHPDAGYKGTQEQAARYLEIGRVYIIRRLDVGRSESTLYLDGPGLRDIGFSTVLFEPAEAPSDWDDDEDTEKPPMSTAGDLLAYLATQPRDRKVVLQKDAEGNGYSPLADAGEALYVAESTSSGSVYPTPENVAVWVAAGHGSVGDWTVPDDGERVIVLGPVN